LQNRSIFAEIQLNKLNGKSEKLNVMAVHLKGGTKDQDMKLRQSQMRVLEELCTPLPDNFIMLGDMNEELFVKNKDDQSTI